MSLRLMLSLLNSTQSDSKNVSDKPVNKIVHILFCNKWGLEWQYILISKSC